MAAVEAALRKRDPNRVVGKLRSVQNFKQSSYAERFADGGDALRRHGACVLIFSALGIFGLATFNVNTRTRQIGTRRAVGARKRDIVSYFMAENWMVTTLGVVRGLRSGARCRASGCRTSSDCRDSTSTSSWAASRACGPSGSWRRGSRHCGRPRSRRPMATRSV